MAQRKPRLCALVPVALLVTLLAGGAAAAGTGLLTPARKFKDAAAEKLKASPGSPVESDVTKALNLLDVARKLLLKHGVPLPQEVFDEVVEVNALLYWARGKLPRHAASAVTLGLSYTVFGNALPRIVKGM